MNAILLDLSAAFNAVNHHTFLCDLKNLGITGFAFSWLKFYLTDRSFKNIVNEEKLSIDSMKYGLSQGTI